ncbi:hypothetical protein, partial [Cetobacterium sp.]|uniref:hypothetical protein n=1 Tax=Cetobacterium sp. TaxID=2071632 RepID=UPI003F3BA35C
MKKLLLGTLLITGAATLAQDASLEKTTTDIISLKSVEEKSAQLSIFPEVSLGASKENSISKFSFNILGATNKNVTGLDISILGLRTVEGNFKGQHLS